MYVFTCLLVAALLTACGGSPAVEVERESPNGESPQPADESSLQIEQPVSEPADLIMAEDMVYPGAQFLIEVPGFGGPMTPWRFYAVPNISTDEAANFYLEKLPHFIVENDEIINGHRHIMLTYSDVLNRMDDADGYDGMVAAAKELDGALIGLEVIRSGAVTGFNRLGILMESYQDGNIMNASREPVEIPMDTTIIILEHYSNTF